MGFGWSSRSPSRGGKRRRRRGASSSERAIRPSVDGEGTQGAGGSRMRDLKRSGVLALVVTISALAVVATPGDATGFAIRTLDGSGNNVRHLDWGRAGTVYLRVGPANYANGISSMATGPSLRYVSNRVFND